MITDELALLYPGHAAEDDYPRLAAMMSPPVSFRVIHTSLGDSGDAHTVEALRDMGAAQRLADGVASLSSTTASVVWACTSGSFVYGWQGAHQQVEELADVSGLPASSASLAFAHALDSMKLRRVAVAATYPEDVTKFFVQFLRDGGFEVVSASVADVMTATSAGQLDDDVVTAMVCGVDCSDAEAILVPDTALHTIAVLAKLELTVGKPVLTANQVCAWEAMRLAGVKGHADAGRLFARPS